MKTKFVLIFILINHSLNIKINDKVLLKNLKKDNPEDEKLGKETKGDSIGTNLYNMQVVTKSLIRPQHWFFNVILTRPSTKYFREAESNGLHYQIDRLKNDLERDYHANVDNYHDQKLENYEKKLNNGIKARKQSNVVSESKYLINLGYTQSGLKFPNFQKSFIELDDKKGVENRKTSLIDVNNSKNTKNGIVKIDPSLIDDFRFKIKK